MAVKNSKKKARTNTVSMKARTRRMTEVTMRSSSLLNDLFSVEIIFCWKYVYGMVQLQRSFTVLSVLVQKLFNVPYCNKLMLTFNKSTPTFTSVH